MSNQVQKKREVQCVNWDFRLSAIIQEETKTINKQQFEKLQEWLKKWTFAYVFQLEKGAETGYIHYQGRFRLLTKTNKHPLLRLIESHDSTIKPQYLERTTNKEYLKRSFDYQLKEDTRILGPWSSQISMNEQKDETKEEFEKLKKKYEILEDVEEWHPFQKKIIESLQIKDIRCIDCIYNPRGCAGKSTVCDYLDITRKGLVVPLSYTEPHKIMECIYGKTKPILEAHVKHDELVSVGAIIIDIPRAMEDKKIRELFILAEQLKKGLIIDNRNTYKEIRIRPPRVWIFMNTRPNLKYLSKDRLRVWTINPKTKDLEKYIPPKSPEQMIESESESDSEN
jgi:hypothetical protein